MVVDSRDRGDVPGVLHVSQRWCCLKVVGAGRELADGLGRRRVVPLKRGIRRHGRARRECCPHHRGVPIVGGVRSSVGLGLLGCTWMLAYARRLEKQVRKPYIAAETEHVSLQWVTLDPPAPASSRWKGASTWKSRPSAARVEARSHSGHSDAERNVVRVWSPSFLRVEGR